jgi:hypothetical protein
MQKLLVFRRAILNEEIDQCKTYVYSVMLLYVIVFDRGFRFVVYMHRGCT